MLLHQKCGKTFIDKHMQKVIIRYLMKKYFKRAVTVQKGHRKAINNINGQISRINLELTLKICIKKKSASHVNNMTMFSLYHPILVSSVRTWFSKIDAMLHPKYGAFQGSLSNSFPLSL